MAANLEDFLAGNVKFTENFSAGEAPLPPSRKTAIIACMDARLHPEAALGLNIGDSHMIRNAGGRAAEALRSLAISQQLLGTEEVYIIHHTDCGMVTFKNEDIHGIIKTNLGHDASGIDFLPFPDWRQSVADDVLLVRDSPLVKAGTPITGLLYDVKTGKMEVISTAIAGKA